MFRTLCILFAAAAVILCGSCTTTIVDNSNRSAEELCLYMMQKTGGKFDGMMAVGPIRASEGFALKIANRQVAFYKYDLRWEKTRAKIDYVNKNHFIYIYGDKFSAVSNGCFIMVDYETNPLKDELLEAFKNF